MNILDLGINYGTLTTINFQTTINKTGNGFEQRLPNWDEPLLSFQIGNRNLDNEEIFYLQNFFDSRKGSYETFLIKDWSDYFVVNQQLNIVNGLNYQLYKSYAVNSDVVNRIITKPKIDTIEIFIDEVQQLSGWSLNFLTGIITFDVAPMGTVTANFEFYVPVRFVEDKIDYRFKGYEKNTKNKIYALEQLSLLEVRETPEINFININEGNYNFIIDLGFDYETLGGEAYNTKINQIASGFETRRQNWLESQGNWDIGQRKLNLAELSHLISAFRLCKGQFGSFFYRDWKDNKNQLVRFGEDNISFRFDAIELSTQQVIFDLSGVVLTKDFGYRINYIVPLLDNSGSMDQIFPVIEEALSDFKQTLLNNNVYGSQENLDKYYKSSQTFDSERYLNLVAQDYRDTPNEEHKYYFLVFINESSPVYHNVPQNNANEPTETWLSDYNLLKNLVLNYQNFKVLIIVPYDMADNDVIAFENHISQAISGFNNYSDYALNDLEFSYETIDYNANSQDYYNLIANYFNVQ